MAKKKDLTHQVAIRMDSDLAQRLADDAHRNERTMAQHIRFLLRQGVSGAPA